MIQSIALRALVEEPGLIPNIHMVAHNYPYVTPEPGDPMLLNSEGTRHTAGTHTDMRAKHSYT